MAVLGNIGTGRARHSVRAAMAIRTHSLASDGGQRTARPTANVPMLSLTAIISKVGQGIGRFERRTGRFPYRVGRLECRTNGFPRRADRFERRTNGFPRRVGRFERRIGSFPSGTNGFARRIGRFSDAIPVKNADLLGFCDKVKHNSWPEPLAGLDFQAE